MASPFYFVAVPTATTIQVQIWLVGGTNALGADFTGNFDPAQGTYVSFSGAPSGWTSAVNPGASSITVSMANFATSDGAAASSDEMLLAFNFNRVSGAPDFTFSFDDGASYADPDLNTVPVDTPTALDFTFFAVTDDVASATEAGGVANGTPGSNPTGNVLFNDVNDGGITVTDLQGGTLGTPLDGLHGSLTLQSGGFYTYTVDQNDAAVQALNVGDTLTDTFTYTATSTLSGETATETLTVTINGVDDAPTSVAIGNQEATYSLPFAFTAPAFPDVDNAANQITYAATLTNGDPLPTWLTFDPATHAFSGTPPVAAFGSDLSIRVTATDPANLSASSDFTLSVTCFGAGTRIETDRGPVEVQDLQPGDKVRTVVDQGWAPVQRLRHRHIDCARHPQPDLVWPVRIAAGAFAPAIPARDLVLSPDHAIFVPSEASADDAGVLIPAKYLVNGTTIRREPVDRIDYYHVELPRHDVLLAEGLTTESYLDIGDNAGFDPAGRVVALHPDFTAHQWEAEGCAELVVTGPRLAAVNTRLQARAAALQSGRARSASTRKRATRTG